MRHFGLIGFPLTHSFSKKYFTEKFLSENIVDCKYDLYPIEDVQECISLFGNDSNLVGLNVTIPYKQSVIKYLDKLDPISAGRIGAVNVIKKTTDGQLVGYNSDYYGFKNSLIKFLGISLHDIDDALILGKGGAALAVQAALEDLNINHKYVSRASNDPDLLGYEMLNEELIHKYKLIINCSPVGMYPNIQYAPNIPYKFLTNTHYLYDLVYNPENTLFMKNGQDMGANTCNGLEMLILQAEKAWDIWNEH